MNWDISRWMVITLVGRSLIYLSKWCILVSWYTFIVYDLLALIFRIIHLCSIPMSLLEMMQNEHTWISMILLGPCLHHYAHLERRGYWLIYGLIVEGFQLLVHAVQYAVIWWQSVMKWIVKREAEMMVLVCSEYGSLLISSYLGRSQEMNIQQLWLMPNHIYIKFK